MPASPRLYRPSLPLCLLLGGLLIASHARADAAESAASAGFLTQPVSGLGDMMAPVPWGCGGAAPATQSILELHWNWHCSFDNTINPALGRFPNDGNRFFGFHRQFLYTFNTCLLYTSPSPRD